MDDDMGMDEVPSEPTPTPDPEVEEAPDLVALAQSSEDLSTLVEAVAAAELVETLASDGPFTVFAPTNDAFAALPAGTLETLLEPANQEDLAGVLTYHVVPGAVRAEDLEDGMTVTTVNGAELTIGVSDAGVSVNDASVVTADLEAANGVVHVIDAVLLPPSE
ncbi:fasciclin domain-containing protein [Patescibacteria group bacterium]|nr:fasciclin domain-containing protein [Patescibacteria group bacterium]